MPWSRADQSVLVPLSLTLPESKGTIEAAVPDYAYLFQICIRKAHLSYLLTF